MDRADWELIGLIVAGMLAGVDLVRSRAQSLTAWGLLIVVVILASARV